MLQRITNLLKGQVTAHVESGFPERVLNLCAEYGVRFWGLAWESPTAFRFTMDRQEYQRLRRLTRRLDCDLTVLESRGVPVFLGRLRHRYALVAGLVVCSLTLVWASFFIWDFRIEGNERISETEILRALEKNGVGLGTYGYAVNSPILRNDMLLDVPELSYIAVNVRGCRAYVQVRERVHPPEILDKKQTGNTIAVKDALVTEIQPWMGEKQVLPGTTVTTGQLLISGVVENDINGARCTRGMGRVMGETWYELRCKVPLTVSRKVYTGEEKRRRALLLGKKRIDLYFNSSNLGDTCDKITNWDQWTLPGDVALPVTVATTTLKPYQLVEERRTKEEALGLAEKVLKERLAGYMEEGRILKTSLDSCVQGDMLLVTLHADCEEEIGKFQELPKE